jgi:hypothetical protein
MISGISSINAAYVPPLISMYLFMNVTKGPLMAPLQMHSQVPRHKGQIIPQYHLRWQQPPG